MAWRYPSADGAVAEQIAGIQEGRDALEEGREKSLGRELGGVDLELARKPGGAVLRVELLADGLDVLGRHQRIVVRRATHALANDLWSRGQQKKNRIGWQVGFDL